MRSWGSCINQHLYRRPCAGLGEPGPAFLGCREPDVNPGIRTETTVLTLILPPRWVTQDTKSLTQLEGISTRSSPFMDDCSISHSSAIGAGSVSFAGVEGDLDI